MNNNISKYSLSGLMLLSSAFALTSCADWTEVESVKLVTPTLQDKNPQLYADYIQDLKRYKESDHKVLFVAVDNVKGGIQSQADRLTAMPDSIDYICLNNPGNLGADMLEEVVNVKEKGTKVIYTIDYNAMESEWKAMSKENPKLTEEQFLEYITEQTTAQIALCDEEKYDGIVADYNGRSLVSLTEANKAIYNARQQTFLSLIAQWKNANANKTLVFYGNAEFLLPENMQTILSVADFVMIKSASSTNADDLSMKAFTALQAGVEAAGEGATVGYVPADRFVVCTMLPQADDKDKIKGYWNTLDANGNKTLAAQGCALWVNQTSQDITRKGVFVQNVKADYYNNTYATLREVISIMNPNK